jgi:hypothetical protein
LIGVWSSTEWAPAVSIIFVVDENRLYAQGKDIDLDNAIAELLASARKQMGRTGISVQITASARTLSGISAFDLLVAHRQVDMDVLPMGNYAAKDTILALAAAGTKPRAAPQ